MFELEADQMEFGLGIHGEPGCERSQYRTAKEIVQLLLEKLESSQKLKLKKGFASKNCKISVLFVLVDITSKTVEFLTQKKKKKWLVAPPARPLCRHY